MVCDCLSEPAPANRNARAWLVRFVRATLRAACFRLYQRCADPSAQHAVIVCSLERSVGLLDLFRPFGYKDRLKQISISARSAQTAASQAGNSRKPSKRQNVEGDLKGAKRTALGDISNRSETYSQPEVTTKRVTRNSAKVCICFISQELFLQRPLFVHSLRCFLTLIPIATTTTTCESRTHSLPS